MENDEITENIDKTGDKVTTNQAIYSGPFLIGVSGGSASGKTSVSQILFKLIGIDDCVMISMDSYYKELSEETYKNLSEYNFDHPNAYDFDLILKHLKELRDGKDIESPVYNFNSSKRENFTHTIKPSKLIIFEGILALYDKRVRSLMDMMIFVDTDDDIRLARRIYRDIKERGRNLENVIRRYHKFVKPAFDEYIKPTRKVADVIIPRGAENLIAIEMVSQYCKYLINRFFPKANTTNTTFELNFTLNDIIDSRYQFYNKKVILHDDNDTIEVLKDIIEDFINGKRINYYRMFLDELVNSILKLFRKNNELSDYTILTEFTDLNNIKCNKKILYFKPFILSELDNLQLDLLLKNFKDNHIDVLSIYLLPKLSDTFINKQMIPNIRFFSLYFSDLLDKFATYISKGGISEEGDLSINNYSMLNKENIIEFFSNIVNNYK